MESNETLAEIEARFTKNHDKMLERAKENSIVLATISAERARIIKEMGANRTMFRNNVSMGLMEKIVRNEHE